MNDDLNIFVCSSFIKIHSNSIFLRFRFLLADQLKGPSSVDGFIHALMRGCRCLELHCFDGPDGQPLVHNATLTSRIPVHEVLEAINNYAFEISK